MKQIINDNFEETWQKAFDQTSIVPPSAIWENIEKTLPAANILPDNIPNGKLAISTKILLSTALIIITGLIFFTLNKTNNKKDTLANTKTQEIKADILKQPQYLEVAKMPIAKSNRPVVKPRIVNVASKLALEANEILPIKIISVIDEIPAKIEEKAHEIAPKCINISKVQIKNPEVNIGFDNPKINSYYDPNAVQPIINKKGKFWQNLKVSGSFGIGQEYGTNSNSNNLKKGN